MAAKVRDFNWTKTPLGPITQWPVALRVAVDLMLSSAFPKCLFWGEHLVAIFNDAYVPLIGNKADSLGEPYHITYSEAWDDLKPIIDKAWAGEATFIEDHLIPLDRFGKLEDAWFTFCYSPVRDDNGAIAGIMDTVVETTGKIRAQREQAAERQRLLTLFNQAPTFMAVISGPDHVFDYVNGPYVSLINGRDVVGKPLGEALPEVVEQGFIGVLDEVRRTGRPFNAYSAKIELLQADGSLQDRYLDFVYQPIVGADGAVASIFVQGADVTQRHAAEQALRELNENLEAQVEQRSAQLDRVWRKSRDVQIVVDLQGRFLAVSPAWQTILGRDPADAIGRMFSEFMHEDDLPAARHTLANARTLPDRVDVETRFLHSDGTPRWLSWRSTTEGDAIYGYGRDITAEKLQAEALRHTEDALRQAQKMEAVGQLTGGIAHDFNNMLAVITGSLDLLNRRLGDADPRAKRQVDAAAEAARRAAALTQRLLAFSRQQPLRPQALNVNSLVSGMSDLLRPQCGQCDPA
ncbi:sensory box protein [Asticcacaulis biprosthecium C19]|uniref:histidine kinase n=2 Tax=Asticcacaulis biprosthecium TaxID=76891 RepID=F4QND3_9CAUL|nr:sensory box protein [Asticcacaulis biprosthecium C19]